MKFSTPEIAWHNRDPVYSVDLQPVTFEDEKSPSDVWYRLATSGADAQVIIWRVFQKKNFGGGTRIEVLSQLVRHEKAVNVVRFVPTGEDILASADVDGIIIIWKKGEVDRFTQDLVQEPQRRQNTPEIIEIDGDQIPVAPTGFEDDIVNIENWNQVKVLRGHLEDVVDISWSKDGKFLVSGSVDNEAIVWNVATGTKIHMLSGHKSWVQGVSWDPLNQFLTTLSSDRSLRIFSSQSKKTLFRNERGTVRVPSHLMKDDQEGPEHKDIRTRLFYDYTMQSFTRRLSFSPEGELLLVPSGVIEFPKKPTGKENVTVNRVQELKQTVEQSGSEETKIEEKRETNDVNENGKEDNVIEDSIQVVSEELAVKPAETKKPDDSELEYINVCHIFLRSNLQKPLAYLPTHDKFTHAVRFCPRRFTLNEGPGCPENLFPFPYRLVFAIATQSTVILYDTQQLIPFAFLSEIHYTRISDVAWTADGRLLMISSTDGFCTFVTFGPEELGVEYTGPPYEFPQNSSATATDLDAVIDGVINGELGSTPPKKKKKQKDKQEQDKVTTPTVSSPSSTTTTPTTDPKKTPIVKFFSKLSKEERFEKLKAELEKVAPKVVTPKEKTKDTIEDAINSVINDDNGGVEFLKITPVKTPQSEKTLTEKETAMSVETTEGAGDSCPSTNLDSTPITNSPSSSQINGGSSAKKAPRRINFITLTKVKKDNE